MSFFFLAYRLCWGKFGWGSQKVDELLVPVLKEYDKHEVSDLGIFFRGFQYPKRSCYLATFV